MLTQADIEWVFLDSVDSTNAYLIGHSELHSQAGVVAVVAHQQTHGRGRAGRSWVAKPGGSLCLSIGLPVASAVLPSLPLCVGVGVAQCLQSWGVGVQLKWPNDLLINGEKLGGILCEGIQGQGGALTVVGIGLNIQPLILPERGQGLNPTSLMEHWALPAPVPTPQALAHRLVPCVVSAVELALEAGFSPIAQLFAQRDALFGQAVCVKDGADVVMRGQALGLAADGAYLVRTETGVMPVHVGDLSLRSDAHA